jgi:2,3,4,5-tetrahydropyridine-2-carboxylate N-succinyltransferase
MSVTIDDDYRDSFSQYEPETLQDRMEVLNEDPSQYDEDEQEELLSEFIYALEQGDVRAAEQYEDGEWEANAWVKEGILSIFGLAENMAREDAENGEVYHDVMPRRNIDEFLEKGARNTPGTTLRVGNYFGDGATVMSEAYANIGAYVDDGTMIDSNVTFGSAAQMGEDGHVGANTTIGGVLDPAEKTPVVIGDNVSIGAGSRITGGAEIGNNVNTGEELLLSPGIEVYDLVDGEILEGEIPSDRTAFRRSIESSVSDHELFDEDESVQKPIVVAVEYDEDAVELEDTLRMD